MKNRKKALCFLLLNPGLFWACSGSDTGEKSVEASAERSGKEVVSVEKAYQDISPDISADGTKVIFISGRSPHEGVYKVYKYTVGTSTAPERVTSADLGEEIEARLSPDGDWVAIKVIGSDSLVKLFIQSFNDSSQRLEVANDNQHLFDMSFASWSPPELAFLTTDASGVTALKVVRYTVSGNTPTFAETQTDNGLNSGEADLAWIHQTGRVGLITRRRSGVDSEFIFRARPQSGVIGAAESIIHAHFQRSAKVAFTPTNSGIAFSRILHEKTVTVDPEADKTTELPKVYLKHKAIRSSIDGATVSEIDSKQYIIRQMSSSTSGDLLGLLGYEAFACQAAGDKNFYGSSLVFATGGSVAKLILQDNGDEGIAAISSDYCSAFRADQTPEAQPVDLQIDSLRVAATFQSNVLNFVYQTWHRGDDEIMFGTGTFDGTTFSGMAFTFISANQKP